MGGYGFEFPNLQFASKIMN